MIPLFLRSQLIANGRKSAAGIEIDPRPVVKIFDPSGAATWLVTEIDPNDDRLAFGLADLGLGCPELGCIDLLELAATRNRFGLLMEVDRHFRPRKPISEYASEARHLGRIVT